MATSKNPSGETPDKQYGEKLRHELDTARQETRERHFKVSGLETALMYAKSLHELLANHMEATARKLGYEDLREDICLIASGGFGRFELGLFSDVDFCFLTDRKPRKEVDEFIKAFLYDLWDLKLDLGYSVHSVRACLEALGNDLHKTTSFFETRYIWGEQGLWEELNERLHSKLRQKHLRWFIDSLGDEMESRYRQYGKTVHLLEPDVKNSRGGLRDIHQVLWYSFASFGSSDLDTLVQHSWISESEYERIIKAWAFLVDVRNCLHQIENRHIDKLSLERQVKVAEMMQYETEDLQLAEEKLMRDYYDHAIIIDRLNQRTYDRLARTTPGTRRSLLETEMARRVDGRFWRRGQRTWVYDIDLEELDSDPYWPLKLFVAAARDHLEISDNTLRKIEERLHRVNKDYRSSPAARDLFLMILNSPGNIANTLRAMNRCGFLSALLPEFSLVRSLPKIDHFHEYTVDEHLIHSVEISEMILTGQNPYRGMEHLAHETKRVLRLDLLHLALLIHDIGKGEGRGHVIHGLHTAQRIGERLGLRPVETNLLRNLVANHQKMGHMVTRRDIADPSLAKELAETVQDLESLRMLYVHSSCDFAAVSKESWNEWRGGLLGSLYAKAADVLRGQEEQIVSREQDSGLLVQIWKEVEKQVECPSDYKVAFNNFFIDMPDRYIRSVLSEDAAKHFVLSTQLNEQKHLTWRTDTYTGSDYVEITFVGNDVPGLFRILCSALAAKGFNILSAQIYTSFSGEAVDIFQTQVPPAFQSVLGDTLDRMCDRIEKALKTGKEIKWGTTLNSSSGSPITQTRLDLRPPQVVINNTDSTTHTVIEVRSPDASGLLSAITKVFDQYNLNIDLAFIATESYLVVDTFYVTDLETNKILETGKLKALEKNLLDEIKNCVGIDQPQKKV